MASELGESHAGWEPCTDKAILQTLRQQEAVDDWPAATRRSYVVPSEKK